MLLWLFLKSYCNVKRIFIFLTFYIIPEKHFL